MARNGTYSASAARVRPPKERPDRFRFGWRYVTRRGANGRERQVRVPLTLDDVLHPREGDHIPENSQQARDRIYVASVLDYRLADRPRMLVLTDCLVNWGVKGLRNHCPDISVFDNVANTKKIWKTFRVAREKAQPLLVVEIVSPDAHNPRARTNDTEIKVIEYHRAGVPLYVLVDQEGEDGSRKLIGYRRGPKKYQQLPLDEQGRLLLESLGLLLQLREGKVVCFDAATGEEIPDFTAMAQARQAEAEARRAAEAKAAELQSRAQAAEAALAEAQARLRQMESERGKKPPAI